MLQISGGIQAIGTSEIVAFFLGAISGGLLSRTVPNLVESRFRGSRLKIIKVEPIDSNDNIKYDAIVKNHGQMAKNCKIKIGLSGSGEIDMTPVQNGRYESSFMGYWKSNDSTSIKINKGASETARLFAIDKTKRSPLLRLASESGYDNKPPKAYVTKSSPGGQRIEEVEDFKLIDFHRAEIVITSDDSTDKVEISLLPWNNNDREFNTSHTLLRKLAHMFRVRL